VADSAADRLCVLSAVFDSEGDTETDFDRTAVVDWLIDPDAVTERPPEPLVEYVATLTVEDSVELNDPVELADGDDDPDVETVAKDPDAERVAKDSVAALELLIDAVPLIETHFDTIPVIVCVIVRISVRVPVAVTESDAVAVVVEVFEPIELMLAVTLAVDVFVVVGL